MTFILWILVLFCVFSACAFWKFLYRFITEGEQKIVNNMFMEEGGADEKQ